MKVYNLENIKSAAELKHWTEVINMNERSIIVLDTFTSIAQKLQAVSISLFHVDIEEVMSQLQDLRMIVEIGWTIFFPPKYRKQKLPKK